MAADVAWSEEALEDLDAGSRATCRGEFFELADSIAANPLIGRIVPELKQQPVRECFLYSYRLIYEIGSRVDILAVIHGRRLLETIEDRFQRS